MIKELLYKWFGLEDPPCKTCEVLRMQLARSEEERHEILSRLLDKDKPEQSGEVKEEEIKPITSRQFVPWRVRQHMLESEDREKAKLLRAKAEELAAVKLPSIDDLEKELGVSDEKEKPA